MGHIFGVIIKKLLVKSLNKMAEQLWNKHQEGRYLMIGKDCQVCILNGKQVVRKMLGRFG